MGKLHYFLGTKILQDEKSMNLWIGQPAYTNKLLTKFGMQDCRAVDTALDVSTKLIKATSDDECVDQQLYQSTIESLLYLSVSTRPVLLVPCQDGYLFQISGGAITWSTKKQSCVALSTAEAECIALASAAQEAIWLRQLTADLGDSSEMAIIIYEDNQLAISMTKNPQFMRKQST